MPRQISAILLALTCAANALPLKAIAVPVNYTEAISGDLSGANPLNNFALDVGINTISGTFGSPNDVFTDSDSFALTVPSGMEIFSGLLSLTDNTGDIFEATWNLNAGSASLAGGTLTEVIYATSPGAHVFSSVPLGANTYNLTNAYFASSGPNPNLSNFTFTFGVRQVVPEPTALVLALACAAYPLSFRRRRQG